VARPIESFRGLKVGDRVRLVEMPAKYRLGYNIHRETWQLYKQLLARGRSMRICKIDDWGLPYIYCRFRRKNRGWVHHWFGLDETGWVLVERRRPQPRKAT
jgi:hypothetical protein